jgi:hypothetical protein
MAHRHEIEPDQPPHRAVVAPATMGCAVSDDNADQLVQQRFREPLKSAAFSR